MPLTCHLRVLVPLVAVACTALCQAQNLLANPSFEDGQGGIGLLGTPGWVVEYGTIDIGGPFVPGAEASSAVGLQFCELVGTPGLARISQTINTLPGKRYVISGYMARHPGLNGGTATLDITVGNVTRQIVHDAQPISAFQMRYKRFKATFVASTSQTYIAFADTTSSYIFGGAHVDGLSVVQADLIPRKRQPGRRMGEMTEELLCDDPSMEASYDYSSGEVMLTFDDPVPTRGLPLANKLVFNSSDYEAKPSGIGNFTFTYDIRLNRDVLVANEAGEMTRRWVLRDGDGSTIDCGPSDGNLGPTAPSNMFSKISPVVVFGAGPPGNIDEAGNFKYEFNLAGRLTSITDPSNNKQLLTYQGDFLKQVLDVSSGRKITTVVAGGKIRKFIENGGSIVTSISYVQDRVASISVATDVETVRHDFGYDSMGRMASVIRDGQKESRMTFSYRAVGPLDPIAPLYSANVKAGESSTGVRWGLPSVMPELPDAMSSFQKVTAKGVTDYQLDAYGRVVGILHPKMLGQSQRKVTKLRHTEDGLPPLEVIDDVSISSSIYNSDGQLVDLVVDDVYGLFRNRYQFAYVNRNLTSVRDDLRLMAELTYGDILNPNRPTQIRDASGNQWTLSYNGFGQPTTIQKPGAITSTQLEYWESGQHLGLLKRLVNAAGNEAHFLDYNLAGDPTRIETSPSPGAFIQRQLAYDALHRVTSLTHDDGRSYRWRYLGRYLNQTIDEAGTTTQYTHCKSCGKLVGVSGPLGWRLGWTYDGDKDLRVFTDARGNATSYTYGPARELTLVTYPDGSVINWTYGLYIHPQGRSDIRRNARNQRTETFYDQQGRVKRNEHLNSGFAGEHFEYNVDGTLKTAVEGGNFISDSFPIRRFTYWPNRTVKSETYKNASWGLNALQTVKYDYNPDRTVSQMRWKTGDTVCLHLELLV